jgi:tRNA threonylcarbamoyladenosine biosynthesis protein TsaB
VTDIAVSPIRLLAIECSSAVASVAIWDRGEVVCRQGVTASATVDHVLQWCEALLHAANIDANDLDAIAVGVGPGAFTGVRIAISVAQGLALAWRKPVVPVSSLAALAMAVRDAEPALPVLAVMDARMDEVYAGWYAGSADGAMVGLAAEEVLAPAQLRLHPAAADGYRIVGNAWPLHAERLAGALPPSVEPVTTREPDAGQVARLAATLGIEAAICAHLVEPAYIRNKVALTTAERVAARDRN